jgi:hypothetical protein
VLQLAAQVLATPDDELVVLDGRVVVEGDGDDEQVEERFPVRRQRRAGRDGDRPDRPALRAEPALPGQPVGQQSGELLVQTHPDSSAGVIENQ